MDDGIDILNEIARIRGVGPALIHIIIHEFDWFMSSMIGGKASTSEKTRAVYAWGKTQKLSFELEKTLTMWILLFRKWYREVQEPAFEEAEKKSFTRSSQIL